MMRRAHSIIIEKKLLISRRNPAYLENNTTHYQKLYLV